jgi:hypothetical protein
MSFIEDMSPGITLTAALRETIENAFRAFSEHQLRCMVRAGVRFWNQVALPPELQGLVSATSLGAARYLPQIRLIQLRPNAPLYHVRHEMAHAWDHVRNDDVNSLIGKSAREILRIARHRARLGADSRAMRQYSLHYRNQINGLRTRGNLAVPLEFDLIQGYSMNEDPREFYAEGYNVFHGNQIERQARLWRYARELYTFLENEAHQQGLGVPDSSRFPELVRDLHLPSPLQL